MQVNCVYKKGSTGKIVYDIHRWLEQNNIDSIVCYGRGEKTSDHNVFKTCSEFYSKLNNLLSRLTGIMYGGCYFSTCQLIKIINIEKPDIVHLQCINGYFVNIYKLLNYLKQNKIKTVLTLHAEFMYTGGCGHTFDCEKWADEKGCKNCFQYKEDTRSLFRDGTHSMWRKMRKAFEGFDSNLLIVSVSPWLMNRAQKSVILRDKTLRCVYNGLDTSVFYHRNKNTSLEGKYVFHASPNFNDDPNNIKGGYYVIEIAKRFPDCKFIVAGPNNAKGELPTNMLLLGAVRDQDYLAELYSNAELTLLTSQRETFSMVTAESLSCGTPVVGFYAGAPEEIAIKEYSFFSEYGNINELQKSIEYVLAMDLDHFAIAKHASKIYSREVMCHNYMKIYEELFNAQ